jgi:vacuolar protein-sorting-associated protein 4
MTSRLVKQLFKMAQEKKPAIIFIDEVESLLPQRDQLSRSEGSCEVLVEFLTHMDGVGNDSTGVVVLGATNLPWRLDQAMRRRYAFAHSYVRRHC